MKYSRYRRLSQIALLIGCSGAAMADGTVYLDGEASLCETYRAFRVSSPECKGANNGASDGALGATRSIHIRNETGKTKTLPDEVAVSIPILFEFNSYSLTPASRSQLKKIATVFKHGNLSGKTILIEGHADASGSETYNLELSRNRADAVRRFLEQNEQVDNLNFYVEGKGESDLFNPLDPYAAENRRVEFVVGAAGGRK